MPATLLSKGQVTIPQRIRDVLNIKQGDAVDFIVEKGDVKLKGIQKGQARALAGSLRRYAKGRYSKKRVREVTKRKMAIDLNVGLW
jgi:AbrB family looped-hinge helix DNA binding protein